ncbi:MAG: hypothetical protein M1479_08280 [Actinobacteria bacterium]|nr:hypothetical protein [Cyanobacteriota bacterium]MCL5772256.1 hypothetical protein [Actinomycetota bacterium]
MEPFSIRNKIKKEYSGYGKASKELRNRLLQLYGYPYSGDEYNFGTNNTNWIHAKKFSKDLQMHFGKKISIEDFRDETKTTYDNVFDFIELYYKRALQDLDYNKRNLLYRDIRSAFKNSGSVYEFSEGGLVILALEKETIENINVIKNILEPYYDAKDKFVNLCNGLIDRSIDPSDAIGDMFIVFEDYLKKITRQNSFENAIRELRKFLHKIQIKLIDNLKAYRGDVWGPAHAGNSPKPSEEEALWYLEMLLSQIKYINRKIK